MPQPPLGGPSGTQDRTAVISCLFWKPLNKVSAVITAACFISSPLLKGFLCWAKRWLTRKDASVAALLWSTGQRKSCCCALSSFVSSATFFARRLPFGGWLSSNVRWLVWQCLSKFPFLHSTCVWRHSKHTFVLTNVKKYCSSHSGWNL